MAIPDVAIYGMGRFGRALAEALAAAGRPPLRTGGGAQGPAALIAGLKTGTLVVLSVRDDAIAEVASQFAALAGSARHKFVHSSGSQGMLPLRSLERAGCQTGAFHILQSFPPQNAGARVPGSWCAIAGPKLLLEQLRSLAKALQMNPIELPDAARPAYHAAAVLASNALVTLLAAGESLLTGAGVPGRDAAAMLLPLVQGTLENIAAAGAQQALTGPVARGDVETLKAHRAVMPAKLLPLYRALMTQTVANAAQSGRITPAQAKALRKVLDD